MVSFVKESSGFCLLFALTLLRHIFKGHSQCALTLLQLFLRLQEEYVGSAADCDVAMVISLWYYIENNL